MRRAKNWSEMGWVERKWDGFTFSAEILFGVAIVLVCVLFGIGKKEA